MTSRLQKLPFFLDEGRSGRYVVLELSPTDEGAAPCVPKGRTAEVREACVEVA